jgi:predicted dehydrogenase
MSDPRLAVVGAGSLSTRRIYPYIGAAGARLVGVCDLVLEKAEANASRFGGRAYTDMVKMLDVEKPDGVIICIGPKEHAELAPVAMKLGIPVYTEKPPALTAADALEVARVSRNTGILCTTAFKKRYNIAYTRARGWIGSLPPESLYSISVDYASGQYPNEPGRSVFLFDFAIHVIDLICHLFGDAGEVFTFARGEDAYAVSIKFVGGAVGSMNLADGRSFTVPTEEIEITAKGGNFMSIHNSSCWRITENQKPCEWREPPTFSSSGDSGNETGHLAELVDFVDALRECRATTRSNIYESYKTMVLYEAIRESAETAQVVEVSYEPL